MGARTNVTKSFYEAIHNWIGTQVGSITKEAETHFMYVTLPYGLFQFHRLKLGRIRPFALPVQTYSKAGKVKVPEKESLNADFLF